MTAESHPEVAPDLTPHSPTRPPSSESSSSTPPLSLSTPPTSPTSPADLGTLFTNPLFAGGLGLAGLGAAAAFARKAVIHGATLLRRQLLVEVEIGKRDPSYPWVLAWLAQPRDTSGFLASRITRLHHLSVATTTRSLKAGTAGGHAGGIERNDGGGGGGGGPVHAAFVLQPGFGRHVVRARPGVYVGVDRQKTSAVSVATGEPHETLTLTLLWAHRHVLEEVFAEAHAMVQRMHEGTTAVYTARGMEWALLGSPRAKRPIGSVVLDEGVGEGLVRDVREFLASRRWYVDRGVPYRRGYLLHGPPGTGKTSFIQALAGELNYCVAIVNLSERGVTDDRLAVLLTKLPARSILLLEDVDSALANRRAPGPDGYAGATVTFSGLLNALDGLAAGEDRIAFLTTNHIELLDPALIRPGRVDVMVRLGEATRYQAARMWDRYYGDLDADHAGRERFLTRLDELGLFGEGGKTGQEGPADASKPRGHTSTAAIQGLFQFHKGDMEGAIRMAEALVPRTFEKDGGDGGTLSTSAASY